MEFFNPGSSNPINILTLFIPGFSIIFISSVLFGKFSKKLFIIMAITLFFDSTFFFISFKLICLIIFVFSFFSVSIDNKVEKKLQFSAVK